MKNDLLQIKLDELVKSRISPEIVMPVFCLVLAGRGIKFTKLLSAEKRR